MYISIIENALKKYYDDKIDLDIVPLVNIKFGFNYIKHKSSTIDYVFLDVEYNNLLGLNILNSLYKYKNLKFILTTSIEITNVENYVGKEIENNRIFIYRKPINEHNIARINDFLIDDNYVSSSSSDALNSSSDDDNYVGNDYNNLKLNNDTTSSELTSNITVSNYISYKGGNIVII